MKAFTILILCCSLLSCSARTSTILGVTQMVTATADVETTQANLDNGGVERNPVVRPWADNRPAMYGAKVGVNGLLWFASYKLEKTNWKWLGYTLQFVAIGIQGYAAIHNAIGR